MAKVTDRIIAALFLAGQRSSFGQGGETDNPLDTTALFEQFMGIKR